jgi:hypothetical protein
MSLATALVGQLKARGIGVKYVGPGQLALTGDTANADETVLAAVRLAKPQLLDLFTPPDAKAAAETARVQAAAAHANDPANAVRVPAGESSPPAR